uniref:ABC-type transport system involved in multi-copper enzyme maturation permease component n=1 Tax=Acetithermum autotrophicum TaxID=1446466 RepID=H5SVU2_ACEAU|nr:ABC-type transport system involved in multi-copper enzyme maturation permease component [Candidatus Acetothermum autotrophicum]
MKSNREGSPWRGLWVVVAKEMADHLTSVRMGILEAIVLLTAAGTLYMALQNLSSGSDQFLFLRLFTTSQDPLPAFVGFLGFLVPLIAIALGFDAINGEFNRRTLSRVLAQPIYRDALLLGKFLGGLFTLALVLTAIWLMIVGLGIFRLGVPPTGEEVARGLLFLLATIAYGGIWLGLALVFSVRFRQPATAALAAISVWLFFTVFWGMLVGLIAQALARGAFNQIQLELFLARLSPNTLYTEAILAFLNPAVRAFGPLVPLQLIQLQWAVPTPLPLSQSLLLVWPQLTGLIAGTIVLFAIGYVLFQRQEIRA